MNRVFGFRDKLLNQTVIVSILIDLRFGQKGNQQFIILKIYFKIFMFITLGIEPQVMCDWQEAFHSPIAPILKYTLENVEIAYNKTASSKRKGNQGCLFSCRI